MEARSRKPDAFDAVNVISFRATPASHQGPIRPGAVVPSMQKGTAAQETAFETCEGQMAHRQLSP
jgi:hypothetical protein